jgi:hypothetical protein
MGLIMAGLFTLSSALVLHSVAGTLLFVAGPLTLMLFIAYSASFDQATAAAGLGVAGLTERVLILEVQAWYVILGWRAFTQAFTQAGRSIVR